MKNEESALKIISVFLSYSHKDREIAGEIKRRLEAHGLEVFLAHEDIQPNVEWQDEILRRLKICDIFIPIVSQNFKESNWTDQETGIAVGDDKLIISTSIDLAPYGFIGRKQALKLNESIPDSCDRIIEIIKKSPMKETLVNCAIKKFVESENFNSANAKAKILEEHAPFSDDQANEIIRGFVINNQIRGADWVAVPFVKRIAEKYSDVIKPDLKEEYEKWLAIVELR